MDKWRLLTTPPARGDWNMALDEAILEYAGSNHSLPTLRLYAWDPPCLSLGYAQTFADVDITALQARGWHVVRRATGGKAILHTDELTYSVTGPETEPRLAGSVLESYNRLAKALLVALHELDLLVQVKEGKADSSGATNPVCFEVPSTYEITANGKKLIGSAQARRQMGVLQHGSLPLAGDLRRITQALRFPDEVSRHHAADRLLARATTIESITGQVISWETAAQAFISAFKSVLNIQLEPDKPSPSEISRAKELVQQKYADPKWTERV